MTPGMLSYARIHRLTNPSPSEMCRTEAMRPKPFKIRSGERLPAGATVGVGGVNFSVFSRHASAMSLLLYSDDQSLDPIQVIDLDPVGNRTHFFWHVFVDGAGPGLYFTWRAGGPGDTRATGFRFDARQELLDPWARVVSDALWNRSRATASGSGWNAIRGKVDDDAYDWEGDLTVDHPVEDSIIYEVHVGGFTSHPSARVRNPGTFHALIDKIPYLERLGITDVELMPVMAFDRQDVPPAVAAKGLSNFWGYSPYGFFALHPAYCSTADGRKEFRDMVKALHRAGIGVILDVVFNHTAEGGEDGPSIHFKGLANETFYHLDSGDRRKYRDFTGCGNTVNCNHPVVTHFLLSCLEYWVRDMHVDGFRFDLASVLGRGEDGEPMYHAPLIWAIEFSEVLSHTKLIAEAWDAGGLYQVGDFPGFRFMEWNGQYRDTVRRVVRGENGLMHEVASRVSGSSDYHKEKGKLPTNSINYVTCHDGFTLYDLVSYDRKHNQNNGEDNRDGPAESFSWNCGHEGPTDDPQIESLRGRQARNHMAILLLSLGLPMLLAGDEVLRTQRGNNNCYCQDNELSWFDWTSTDSNAGMLRFTREMIVLRKRHASLRRSRFLTGRPTGGRAGMPDIEWHGARLGDPEWDNPGSRTLAYTLAGIEQDEPDIYVMLNMSPEGREMAIPAVPGRKWHRAVDTSRISPDDIVVPAEQTPLGSHACYVAGRTVAVLESR